MDTVDPTLATVVKIMGRTGNYFETYLLTSLRFPWWCLLSLSKTHWRIRR